MSKVKYNDLNNNNFYSYRDKLKTNDIQPILYLDNGLTLYMNKLDTNRDKFMYNNKNNSNVIESEKTKKFLNKYSDKDMDHYDFTDNYKIKKNKNEDEIRKLTNQMKNNNNFILKFLTDVKGNNNVTIKVLDNELDEISETDINNLDKLDKLNNLNSLENDLNFYEYNEEEEEEFKCPVFKKKKCFFGYNILYYNKNSLGTSCPYIVCNEKYIIDYMLIILLICILSAIMYYIYNASIKK